MMTSCLLDRGAGHHWLKKLNNALPGLTAHDAIGGASGAPGSTQTRACSHHGKCQPLHRGPGDNTTVSFTGVVCHGGDSNEALWHAHEIGLRRLGAKR